MQFPSPLDDPRIAAHAWKRYWRLMRWMAAATAATVIVIIVSLYRELGMVSIHFFIAVGLGVTFAMLLMAALMGLAFLSNATGHDEVQAKKGEKADESPDQSDG